MLVQFGWFVGWVYLRFYKKNTNDSFGGQDTYGDRSETFSLISWFPPFVQYVLSSQLFLTDSPASSHPLSLLGNFVFTWASRLHLIPSAGPDVELGGYGQLPAGMARAEAERRRYAVLNPYDHN